MSRSAVLRLRRGKRPWPVMLLMLPLLCFVACSSPDDDTVANADSPLSGVDHIFLGNGEGVSAPVFGIVVDPFSVMGSDHFPLFADLGL